MRFLICTIFTLLVAILVYLYVTNTTTGTNDSLTDDRSIEQLKRDLADAELRKDFSEPTPLFTPPPITPTPAPMPDLVTQMTLEEEKALADAEIKRQADQLEQEVLAAEKAEIDAEIAENLPPPVTDARLKLIQQALVMATVKHFDEPSRIILLDLTRPENVVNGQILGIRRQQSGIIGRVKIARIQNGQAFADPITESFFGKPVEVNEGDELIVIP